MITVPKIALLIDADNTRPAAMPSIMARAQRLGDLTTRRIYADWSDPRLSSGWKSAVLEYALVPCQQFYFTPKKNATDIAMVIDAVSLLHDQNNTDITGFCIVSSDCDFTPLVIKIKSRGHYVLGIGQQTTPSAFKDACDQFYFYDIKVDSNEKADRQGHTELSRPEIDTIFNQVLNNVLSRSGVVDGWLPFSELALALVGPQPFLNLRACRQENLAHTLADFAMRNLILETRPAGSGTVWVRKKTWVSKKPNDVFDRLLNMFATVQK